MAVFAVTTAPAGYAQSSQLQRPERRPRVNVDVLLRGQPPRTSLADLTDIIQPGLEVVVRDARGRRTRGLFGGIEAARLSLWQRRPFGRYRLRTFTAADVRTVSVMDPVRDGVGKGALTSVPVIAAVAIADARGQGELRGLATLVTAAYAPLVGMMVGELIDAGHVSPVFVSPALPEP